MKRNNKKGFTIVELVIVIAVIAILSAVMIPTFSGIVEKANKSAAQQEANNIYKNYLIDHDYTTVDLEDVDGYVASGDYFFAIVDGQFQEEALDDAPAAGTGNVYTENNGVHLVTKCAHTGETPESTCTKCGATVPAAD